MLPAAQIKNFGNIHPVLREKLDAAISEPWPPEWNETVGRLRMAERQRMAGSGDSPDARLYELNRDRGLEALTFWIKSEVYEAVLGIV